MSNEYVTTLLVSGRPEVIEAFVGRVSQDGQALSFAALVPEPEGISPDAAFAWQVLNWGTAQPDVHGLERSEHGDLNVADFVFSTKGGTPFAFAKALSDSNPDLVVVMATVEPGMRIGEIRVHGNGEAWAYEATDDEMGACVSDETEYPDEEMVLDMLIASAESVIDDYERAIPAGASPVR